MKKRWFNSQAALQISSSVQRELNWVEGVDIIGDVHGCAITLERLLQKLNYSKMNGVYQHPSRRAIFLGDIIDRGPRIREALHLVRDMVERGSAEMILGNHECNAILYHTKHPDTGHYLRDHSENHTHQLEETLNQCARYSGEWNEFLSWFRGLPLFLEFESNLQDHHFRCVHACWDQGLVNYFKSHYRSHKLDEKFIFQSANTLNIEHRIRQRLTTGIDIPLPEGRMILSSDGYERNSFRTKFWEPQARTYAELLFQPDPLPEDIGRAAISHTDRKLMVHYHENEPPLFVGHYWLKGNPKPLSHNIACLDYSAVKYGKLVAYRMDGEQQLKSRKFVWEYVDP